MGKTGGNHSYSNANGLPTALRSDGCFKIVDGVILPHIKSCESCPYPDCCAILENGNVFVFSEFELKRVLSPTMRLL